MKRIDISYRAKLITLAFTIIISLFSYENYINFLINHQSENPVKN